VKGEIELEWEAPPEKRKKSVYEEVLPEIQKRRGQWARVRSGLSSGSASSATQNLRKQVERDPAWEVVARRMDGGDGYGIWVRYRSKEQMQEAK